MRGRNRNNGNKGPNPLTKSYESNGPDVKIRGTAQHIAEKYSQLARDAQASGDPVAAENYFQHAEHYYRIIAAAQEQLREQYGYQQRFDDEGDEDGFGQSERPSFERNGLGNGEETDPNSQPQPYEGRGEGERERPSRFDRNERQDRGERSERGERRERFQRDRAPRQDFQRDEQPFEARNEGEQRNERPARFERGERQDRGDRPERGERRERFQRDRRREEADAPETGSLPAFLTNPVRSAPAPVEEPQAAAPATQPDLLGNEEEARPRRRTRRTRRDVVEGGTNDEASFTPDVETPAAE